MSESEQNQNQLSSNNIDDQMNVAYYSQALAAWVQTRFERDKSILNLSSVAIGMHITLLTFVFEKVTFVAFIPMGFACLLFLGAIICTLHIFNKNAEYLEKVARQETPPSLSTLDYCSEGMFLGGILFSLAFVITLVVLKLQ